MNAHGNLRWTDAWLLLAIYQSSQRGPATLRNIIADADQMNHAVLNYEEVSSGLVRLDASGLIHVTDIASDIVCSRKSAEIISTLIARTKNAIDLLKKLEIAIGAEPWVPAEPLPHPANTLLYAGLTHEIYDNAVSEYLDTMKEQVTPKSSGPKVG